MRITNLIFTGSIVALTALAAPALAKNADTQKSDEKQTSSSSCHAYQQAADGSWTEVPCAENGASAQTTQHKPIARGQEEEAH
jgi:uncharacterized low-complexity protein